MKDFVKSRYFVMGILFSVFFVVVMWHLRLPEDIININTNSLSDETIAKISNMVNNLYPFLIFYGLAGTWALTVGFYGLDKAGFWDSLAGRRAKGGEK